MVMAMVMPMVVIGLGRGLPFAAESDRLAMGRVQVGTPPMLRRLGDFLRCQRRTLLKDGFEGGEPLPIVGGLAVLVGSLRIGPDLPAEDLDPFGPGEQPRLRKRQRCSECLGVPGLAEPGNIIELLKQVIRAAHAAST